MNLALFDIEFLKFSMSLQAVMAVVIVMHHLDRPSDEVRRWVDQAKVCGFNYLQLPQSGSLVDECGEKFLDKIKTLKEDVATDAEVAAALTPVATSAQHSPAVNPRSSVQIEPDHDREHAPSPNDITVDIMAETGTSQRNKSASSEDSAATIKAKCVCFPEH